MNDPIKLLVSSLAAPLRILLMASFLLLAKMGWFTWLTPENYHEPVNALMDFLVVAAPAEIVASAAAVIAPTGGTIVTTPEIANAVPAPNVVAR